MKFNIKLVLPFLFVITSAGFAQFDEFYPEYDWYTIEGKNVAVHYHEEAERTARVVAKIADEVWGPITSLYQYTPETVHFVIKDIDDYSNGATYFFDNKIEIWASALDTDLRGSHNWLRNVISHEFTHLVQIQAGMKLGRSIPAVFLQFMNYEDKRRPDILYGFPNFIASYPIATVNIPAWFAEGTAQYMRPEFNYDNWDTHRDMILRSYSLDDNMLSWNEMGVFSKTSLGNESVYNSGFALTLYIAQKYGEDKLREITHKLGKKSNFTIDAAFEDVLGKDGGELYEEWSSYLKKNYKERSADIEANLVEGEKIAEDGFANFYPTLSEDGKKLLYISNKNEDYMSLTSVFLYDMKTKEEKRIKSRVRSSVAFIPNTNKIVYSKLSDKNPNDVNIHDLYIYDLEKEEEERITEGLRANNPEVSNDGKTIAFVFQKDGSSNLGIVDLEGNNFKRLTFFENGEQVYNPSFSEDDNYIVFDFSYHHGRDLAKVNTDGSGFEFLIQTDADERNAKITEGELYYSSDETGIFNIYSMNLSSGETERLSNVIGGAFMPDIDSDGNIVYSGYTSTGYKIFYLPEKIQSEVDPSKQYVWIANPPLDSEKPKGDLSNFNFASLREFNDYEIPDYERKKYSGFFTRLTFFPFIRYDNYNTDNTVIDRFKPGLYVTSSDMLNRYSLFAGGSINTKMERDLFLNFEYRNRLPILYGLGLKPNVSLELYSVSRESNADLLFGIDSTGGVVTPDYTVNTGVSYDLFEFDLAFKHRFFADVNDIEFRFIFSRYKSTIESFILPDEDNTLYPTTNDTYLIGRNFQLTLNHNFNYPYIHSDINPIGREISLQYNYELNKFNPESNYVIEDGILKPVYDNFNFHKLELNWKEHFPLAKGYTLSARLRAGTIFGPPVPDFFDFYLGGLIGMKAYPFYAISGNELGWLNLTYRMPLWENIDSRVGHLYLDKIFFSVYGDLGNAWTGEFPEIKDFKKGAGAEIRFKLTSFYLFPTAVFFNAAYAFDAVNRDVRGENIQYGKEWNFYGGVLFDFSL